MSETKNNWFAVDILIDDAATEAAEFALNELDALGTEIDSLRKPTGEPLRVTGYFDALPEIDRVTETVDEALRIYGFEPDTVKRIDGRSVEETDWLAEWKKHWRPTVIDQFVIAPPWETVDQSSKIVIRIEPNMAFGTGTHETTQLCLREIGRELKSGESFLDVGTGTGILMIAAAKLGNRQITACDTDTDSVMIARENAEMNGVKTAIDLFEGSIGPETPSFDFTSANLTIDVILPLLDLLLAKTKRVLLLSGILAEQQEMIVTALKQAGKTNYKINQAGEWISVTVFVS